MTRLLTSRLFCTNADARTLSPCRWQFVLHLLYTAFIRIRDLLASCWEP